VHLTLGEVVISNEHTSELWRARSVVGLRRPARCALATRISHDALSVSPIAPSPHRPVALENIFHIREVAAVSDYQVRIWKTVTSRSARFARRPSSALRSEEHTSELQSRFDL